MMQIQIITTAVIPWYTGTSINPLFRAAHLIEKQQHVTIFFPWIPLADQIEVYPQGEYFNTEAEQILFIQQWSIDRGLLCPIIKFYQARFYRSLKSILPTERLENLLDPASFIIFEEPEHLFGNRIYVNIKKKFPNHLGVFHTNSLYFLVFRRNIATPLLSFFWTCKKAVTLRGFKNIVSLSEILPFPNALIANINGVEKKWLEASLESFSKNLFFWGKLIWEKGFGEMINLLASSHCPHLDVFGNGHNQAEIEDYAKLKKVNVNFLGVLKNIKQCASYKIFVNCSRSEVLCTTTMEALAMGKFVIIPKSPENKFFYQFANCLIYETPEEFHANLLFALEHNPVELSPEQKQLLSWEAATDRLLEIIKKIMDAEN